MVSSMRLGLCDSVPNVLPAFCPGLGLCPRQGGPGRMGGRPPLVLQVFDVAYLFLA